jgi:serine/threonine protein kinase
MALTLGSRLGQYEITARIGAGGMGEVYRARDTRLKRDVALKILPESFGADPDRLARFRREAEVLASLNHPHIAQIYDFEEAGGTHALVMELVEGGTLADRIARGPLPLHDVLPIARQICEALEAAHERGIIHRDLKPSNINVRPDGTVKVLDFGLAKLADPSSTHTADLSLSPTITSPAMATGLGTLLGTAAYMSPEQARGKPVDKRADIWAFGCVLFEMLTGRRAFEGEDVSDTLAELLKREPDWRALPSTTPEPVRRVLRRCLAKDPRKRLPDIGAAVLEIDDTLTAPLELPARTTSSSATGQRLAWIVAFVFVITAIALAIIYVRESPPAGAPTTRFSVVTPPALGNPNNIAVSPDGRLLTFAGFDENGKRALWLRPLNALTSRTLPGTDEGLIPFWSPDSRFIGFFAGGKLKKIDVLGGPPQTLCDAAASNPGGTWNREGTILFGGTDGIYRVSAVGGTPTRLTALDPMRQEVMHNLPDFLPDGRHFLYQARSSQAEHSGVYLGSLDSKQTSLVVLSEAKGEYVAPGYVLFVRDSTLMAQPFDQRRLALTGDPFPVVERVSFNPANGQSAFSASDAGVLTYRARAAGGISRLEWVGRTGAQLGVVGDPGTYADVELSPDGRTAAVSLRDPVRGTFDEWLVDLSRGVRTRLTFDPSDEFGAKWSPNGERIAFLKRGEPSGIYVKASSGAGNAQLLVASNRTAYPDSWSPDSRFLMYEIDDPKTTWDLWVQPTSGGSKPWPLVQSEFRQEYGRFSPDGRWVAYRSTESGRSEVYVTPFIEPGGASRTPLTAGAKWQISTAGGSEPRWRRDGRELFYLGLDNRLMAAEVSGEVSGFKVGVVRPLIAIRPAMSNSSYDVSADGQRFLVDNAVEQPGSETITLILNWTTELRK